MELKSRFKEFRRVKAPKSIIDKPVQHTPEKRKRPGFALPSYFNTPSTKPLDGEDEFSFAQHQKAIKTEYKKSKNQNIVMMNKLMELSFAMRRADITVKGYIGVADLFEEYPLLQDYDQV